MKQITILLALFLTGCSQRITEAVVTANNGANGSSCSVEQLSSGSKITCSDGTFAYVYNGKDGAAGSTCSVKGNSSGATITCANSSVNLFNGTNGNSCTVKDTSSGALITCGNSSAAIYDGQDGDDDDDSPRAIGIAGYITPCGANEFDNDEIFLRLTDNNILGLYDGGPHEDRLVLLTPGDYYTSDRNKSKTCHFTVTEDLEITNERVE